MNLSTFDEIATRLHRGHPGPESTIDIHWFLYGLVRLRRPAVVIEIGTCNGDATCFLIRACVDNGFGRVIGYESEANRLELTREKLSAAFPDGAPYELHGAFPLDGNERVAADLVFLDLDPKADYFRAFGGLDIPRNGYLVAHDLTYPPDRACVEGFANHVQANGYEVLRIQEGKGLVVGRKL